MASGTGSATGGSSPFFLSAFAFFAGFLAAASMSIWPPSSSPSLSMTLRNETRPLRISSSPMGERQFVGGLMSFVAAIALCSCSAIARSASARGFTLFLPHGTWRRMSAAAEDETRLNADCRNPLTSRLFDSCAISMSAPSSTPCGCGLISTASFGSSVVARGNDSVSLPGRSVPVRWPAPTGRV